MVKAWRSTPELPLILKSLSQEEVSRIHGVAVKCIDTMRNSNSEGSLLSLTDAEARKRGEQTGLDTLVVHAVNDDY